MQKNLHSAFQSFINKLLPGYAEAKYLLTVSGGLDSVVMAHLFKQSRLTFAIAHCNFSLRGAESDGDEDFVRQLAKAFNVPYFVKVFDTKQFSEDQQVSIQMAARELRYTWFEELRKDNNLDYIVTAHHQTDQLETIFINQIRGTGVAGLAGIAALEANLLRPLLCATRENILQYANQQQLSWREDSSNADDKYARNKIRHHILPVLRDLNPAVEEVVARNAARAKDSAIILKKYAADLKNKTAKDLDGTWTFDLNEVDSLTYNPSVILEWIAPFGFNYFQACSIHELLKTTTGKVLYAKDYVLSIERLKMHIRKAGVEEQEQLTIEATAIEVICSKGVLNISYVAKDNDFIIPNNPLIACFDTKKLPFPLSLRYWQQGDYFYPLGMQGKKLLSDFFIDAKFSNYDKQQTPLLCNGDEVLWIVGHRISERAKLTADTQEICLMEFIAD